MVYMKTFPIILIAVLALAIGIYYFHDKSVRQINQAPIAITWTTYRNNQYGFTIKYPSVYSIDELPEPIKTKYYRFKFLSVVDPNDTSTYELHVVPAAVAIIKQPMVFDGKVYHNLEEYIKAGFGQGFGLSMVKLSQICLLYAGIGIASLAWILTPDMDIHTRNGNNFPAVWLSEFSGANLIAMVAADWVRLASVRSAEANRMP